MPNMEAVASGFLYFYLGVTLVILILCCNIIQSNCRCRACDRSILTDEERAEAINERIIVKKAESFGDFSIRRPGRLAVLEDEVTLPKKETKKDKESPDGGNKDEDPEITDLNGQFQRARSIVSSICGSIASSLPDPNLDSEKKCPICMEEYKIGDEICFSRNNKCPHVFHAECMRNWLMKSNDCPLCRLDYLQVTSDVEEAVQTHGLPLPPLPTA